VIEQRCELQVMSEVQKQRQKQHLSLKWQGTETRARAQGNVAAGSFVGCFRARHSCPLFTLDKGRGRHTRDDERCGEGSGCGEGKFQTRSEAYRV